MKCNNYQQGIFYGRKWNRGREIKAKLMEEFGKCFWCKIEVVVYPHTHGVTPPDNEATLDHLKSKNAGREKGENTPKVLSCRKCNNDRAKLEIIKKHKNDINRTIGI